jgi:N-acetylmuramoyl-L-alanine amidase
MSDRSDKQLVTDVKNSPTRNTVSRLPCIFYIIIIICTASVLICVVIIARRLLTRIDRLDEHIIEIVKNQSIIGDPDSEPMPELKQENSTENRNYLNIINRTEWGAADPIRNLTDFNKPIAMVIIAHTETHECTTFEFCKIQMAILQLYYKQMRNFEDIGYNFVIGGDGAVYEGIGWDKIGYHTKGHNDYSIGIGFIGNYQTKEPTENQLSAAILLLNDGLQKHHLDKNYAIKGQRDFLPIVSPGNKIYDRMKSWDHFKKD